jgi:hypothetical protein
MGEDAEKWKGMAFAHLAFRVWTDRRMVRLDMIPKIRPCPKCGHVDTMRAVTTHVSRFYA